MANYDRFRQHSVRTIASVGIQVRGLRLHSAIPIPHSELVRNVLLSFSQKVEAPSF
jgi:hypothetical protein